MHIHKFSYTKTKEIAINYSLILNTYALANLIHGAGSI